MASKNETKLAREPGMQGYTITREFDAPRELVFKAYTDPKLYVQWLGPRGLEMTLDRFEPNSGGGYRYSHKDADGNSYWFHGVYHEVTAPERIISTFEFEGLPEKGHVALTTEVFEALPGGRTRLTLTDVYQSVADLEGMLESGAMTGASEGYERLDEVLAKLK
jgi:uncharacterized protein YndB with AHSA1/START domain